MNKCKIKQTARKKTEKKQLCQRRGHYKFRHSNIWLYNFLSSMKMFNKNKLISPLTICFYSIYFMLSSSHNTCLKRRICNTKLWRNAFTLWCIRFFLWRWLTCCFYLLKMMYTWGYITDYSQDSVTRKSDQTETHIILQVSSENRGA